MCELCGPTYHCTACNGYFSDIRDMSNDVSNMCFSCGSDFIAKRNEIERAREHEDREREERNRREREHEGF